MKVVAANKSIVFYPNPPACFENSIVYKNVFVILVFLPIYNAKRLRYTYFITKTFLWFAALLFHRIS